MEYRVMAFGVRKREKELDKPIPTRAYSKNQEIAVASSLGGKRTPNSGATAWIKGDVVTHKFLLECKTKATHCNSITVKKEWITKNIEEASFMGRPYQAVVFNFGPDEENYYIIDEALMKTLMQAIEEQPND